MTYARSKGSQAEREVASACERAGLVYAERAPRWGAKDKGDIVGIPGIVVEVKNRKEMALAQWVDEAQVECSNADADLGIVVHKRRGVGRAEGWYCTMLFADALYLLKKSGYGG
jgi:hypothetical protein